MLFRFFLASSIIQNKGLVFGIKGLKRFISKQFIKARQALIGFTLL